LQEHPEPAAEDWRLRSVAVDAALLAIVARRAGRWRIACQGEADQVIQLAVLVDANERPGAKIRGARWPLAASDSGISSRDRPAGASRDPRPAALAGRTAMRAKYSARSCDRKREKARERERGYRLTEGRANARATTRRQAADRTVFTTGPRWAPLDQSAVSGYFLSMSRAARIRSASRTEVSVP
jgi:hypothetical protein